MTAPRKTAAKKATVSRAATKATVKKAARPAAPPEVVAGDETSAPTVQRETITFMGRKLAVRLPSAEQLIAWDSLTKRVQRQDPETVTMADAVKFTSQLYTIIESVMVEPDDVDWLWELRAQEKINLEKASEIITEALKAFKSALTGEPDNRAARRARK